MARSTQISAHLSEATRLLLERYVRSTGVKKQHVVEQALLHYLRVLQEVPSDAIVPARLVLSRAAGEALRERLAEGAPTAALRELMAPDGD